MVSPSGIFKLYSAIVGMEGELIKRYFILRSSGIGGDDDDGDGGDGGSGDDGRWLLGR